MTEEQIQVQGMSCGHCKQSVEKAASGAGAQAQVDLASGIVRLTFDEHRSNLDAIISAIEDQGYDVVRSGS